MNSPGRAEWPQLPFCSQRCKTIDLGRWFGERYRIPAEDQAHDAADLDEPGSP